MALFNGLGRIGWASASDYLGRGNTYFVFFALQIVAFACLPNIQSVILFQVVLYTILTCYGGGFAAAFGFREEGGIDLHQVLDVKDAEKCRALMSELIGKVDEMVEMTDGKPMLTITENALEYAGVQAWRQETYIALPEGPETDAAAAIWLERRGVRR